MRGHIRRRGSKWAVVVDVGRGEDGQRRQRWHSGYNTKRDASRALTELLGGLQSGGYIEPTKQTLGQYLKEWLVSLRASGLRPSTVAAYELFVDKHVIPALGVTPLQKLTTGQLNGFYVDLLDHGRRDGKGGLSPRTVRYAHITIRKALADAVKVGGLARNVADHASPPRLGDRAQPAALTAEELHRFLEHVEADRMAAFYRLAASSGMRRGELLGLTWGAVDLDAARLSISQTLVTVDYAVSFSTPKTRAGRRSIALDGETVQALREHRKRQVEERLSLGGYAEDHDLVFCELDGEPLHPGQVSKRFDRLLRASGVRRIRFHDLRHTHATLALQAGVHPLVVSERLGHSTVSITLDTYSHTIPSMQEEAAEKVAALVAGG